MMNQKVQREQGRKAQLSNIQAGKAVSEIVRTTLGPRSMLKMILDPMGGIVMTNDGNSILREVDVSHPAAKSMIELSRAQEEEVGDGTTSVIILAGEYLVLSEPLLDRQTHPTVICNGYLKALDDALKALDAMPGWGVVQTKNKWKNPTPMVSAVLLACCAFSPCLTRSLLSACLLA